MKRLSSLYTSDCYYLNIADGVKLTGNCKVTVVGAVVVRDGVVIGTGSNATMSGALQCLDGGCAGCTQYISSQDREFLQRGECTCIHAEYNAITNSKGMFKDLRDAAMYVTIPPCLPCAEMIKQNAISRLVCYKPDHEGRGLLFLRQEGVEICFIQSC
jgi:dCMP deaminase